MFCLYLRLRRLWIFVSIVSISSLTSWSYAQEKSPIETLKLRDAMLQELDISKGNLIQEETMRRSIISGFDFKRHSRISLGKYWRNRTEEEQGEFVMNRNAVESIGINNLERMNSGGGGEIVVNITGNVLTSDFVENELAEKVQEAVRKGVDFGIS